MEIVYGCLSCHKVSKIELVSEDDVKCPRCKTYAYPSKHPTTGLGNSQVLSLYDLLELANSGDVEIIEVDE